MSPDNIRYVPLEHASEQERVRMERMLRWHMANPDPGSEYDKKPLNKAVSRILKIPVLGSIAMPGIASYSNKTDMV